MSQSTQDQDTYKFHHLFTSLSEPMDERESALSDEENAQTIHVYPVKGGGILLTKMPLDHEESLCVESEESARRMQSKTEKKTVSFLHFLLILCLFVLLDALNSTMTTLLTPTAIISIMSQAQALSTTATMPLTLFQGRMLSALTLSQVQTVHSTGQGHQDARPSAGLVTFYNGLFTTQSIPAGMVLTGSDGIVVMTDQSVIIPAATPPQFAEASVFAHATTVGSAGNIAAGDINTTIANGVLVRNSQFSGGRDARDYRYLTRGDIQEAIGVLTSQLSQSEQAALMTQLRPNEQLFPPLCTLNSSSNHQPGDEVTEGTVSVSETCNAATYSQLVLQKAEMQLLHTKVTILRKHRGLLDIVSITIHAVSIHPSNATVTITLDGVWVYQINEQQIKTLVVGKPRREAIHMLMKVPGVERISITGLADDALLPNDLDHIHLLILVIRTVPR